MKKIAALLIAFIFTINCFAQKWIPSDIKQTTLLVERYKYQEPQRTLTDVDEEYEEAKDNHINSINNQLEKYNAKLDSIFKTCSISYVTAVPGKIDEEYSDTKKYRYILKRELFFGNKKIINPVTKSIEDKSYFAYRYFFYDRVLKQNYPFYYFSGDQWTQLKRIIYWLNQVK